MEYIRKRKLSLAASQILNGGKVVDVAMEYGFSTHSSFTRAFEKQFGVSPKKYLTITQDKIKLLPWNFMFRLSRKSDSKLFK